LSKINYFSPFEQHRQQKDILSFISIENIFHKNAFSAKLQITLFPIAWKQTLKYCRFIFSSFSSKNKKNVFCSLREREEETTVKKQLYVELNKTNCLKNDKKKEITFTSQVKNNK